MEVPSGATDIKFVMNGGSGDSDLYVKFSARPTDSAYDCRPYINGNSENCNGTQSGGTYYIRLKAYQAFNNVSLTGSFNESTVAVIEPIYVSISNISILSKQWSRYTHYMPDGYENMTVTTSGGLGDADLYVRHGDLPTSTTYDCRPYLKGNNESCTFDSPAQGIWYIYIYGYQATTGVTLKLTATPK